MTADESQQTVPGLGEGGESLEGLERSGEPAPVAFAWAYRVKSSYRGGCCRWGSGQGLVS
jgi:hypothetical protein